MNVIDDDENIPNIDNIIIDVGPEIINNTSNNNEEPYQSFIASENTQPLQVDYIKEKVDQMQH